MAEILKWIARPLRAKVETAEGKGSMGLKVPLKDRSVYFVNDGSIVLLHLLNGNEHRLLSIDPSPSFWESTGELIDIEIRKWVDRVRGLEKWSGTERPKVLVWPLSKNCFAVLGFESE